MSVVFCFKLLQRACRIFWLVMSCRSGKTALPQSWQDILKLLSSILCSLRELRLSESIPKNQKKVIIVWVSMNFHPCLLAKYIANFARVSPGLPKIGDVFLTSISWESSGLNWVLKTKKHFAGTEAITNFVALFNIFGEQFDYEVAKTLTKRQLSAYLGSNELDG